ncbi:helix-turn-helix domain-containing protein [Lactococcus cremoris]|uniref:GH39 family glycosyl hydrolase n=1 Tax=Lactococcus lactis subsp. cremoris TaxID=1359 RepID=UPI0028715405|nr:helix-turn-helix domain-containing protein [Lactococcus cremoris]MDR9868219.1 helix-turn-helix domain-containing protein [Lactococcus cremoris]
MRLIDPWQNIAVRLLKDEQLQFLDNKIHILFVLVGKVTVKTAEKYFTLQKNDFFILPKFTSHTIDFNRSPDTKVFELKLNYFFETKCDDAHEYQFFGNSADQPQQTDSSLVNLINKVLQLYLFKNQGEAAVFASYFSLIYFLEKNYRKKVELKSKRIARQEIEELKIYIDNNYHEEIHLSDLAQKLWISEQYLSRLFSETTGSTLSEYVTNKRLEVVKKALSDSQAPIITIAFEAGFTNISSFNRIFKKNVGETPSQYRKNHHEILSTQTKDFPKEESFNDLKQFFESQNDSNAQVEKINFSCQTSQVFNQQYLINLGDIESLLSYSMANQIKTISEKLPFKYGRLWNVLGRSIVGKVDMCLDFSKINQALDLLIENHLIPFLELGFKGKIIHDTMTHLIKNEPFEAFRSLEEYTTIIEIFIKHCIHRYGSQEVAKWVFEVWKPDGLVLKTLEAEDLAKVPIDIGILNITQPKDYITYFSKIKNTIKKLTPRSLVGGCGISPDISQEDIKEFLLEWKKSNQPDFLSLSFYPMDLIKMDYLANQAPISPDAHYAAHKILNFKNELSIIDWEIPIFLTEFNITIRNRDLINDTAFKGAYILRSVLEVFDTCQMIGYWISSDEVMHYGDIETQEAFGGAGLISYSGIPKVGYYAFEFLGKMHGKICYSDRDILIIKDDDNKLKVLSTNYSHLNSAYYYNSEGSYKAENIYSIFQEGAIRQLKIQLPEDYIKDHKRVIVKQKRIGREAGSFIEEIVKMNAFDNLNQEEVEYLKKRCIPEQFVEIQELGERDFLTINLQPHDVIYSEVSLLD